MLCYACGSINYSERTSFYDSVAYSLTQLLENQISFTESEEIQPSQELNQAFPSQNEKAHSNKSLSKSAFSANTKNHTQSEIPNTETTLLAKEAFEEARKNRVNRKERIHNSERTKELEDYSKLTGIKLRDMGYFLESFILVNYYDEAFFQNAFYHFKTICTSYPILKNHIFPITQHILAFAQSTHFIHFIQNTQNVSPFFIMFFILCVEIVFA